MVGGHAGAGAASPYRRSGARVLIQALERGGHHCGRSWNRGHLHDRREPPRSISALVFRWRSAAALVPPSRQDRPPSPSLRTDHHWDEGGDDEAGLHVEPFRIVHVRYRRGVHSGGRAPAAFRRRQCIARLVRQSWRLDAHADCLRHVRKLDGRHALDCARTPDWLLFRVVPSRVHVHLELDHLQRGDGGHGDDRPGKSDRGHARGSQA
mmetsp:Transcript_77216/g.214715  ORF Transcript_77216/g.214715 Transcript_77216/m.214715 type:complete len:209 (-) Transcript_77216:1220-1846(-)